jgi:hypothetical protein
MRLLSVGVQISLVTVVAVFIAWNNLAAIYVALSFGGIAYMLHMTDVKINKLLDHHRITVRDKDFH